MNRKFILVVTAVLAVAVFVAACAGAPGATAGCKVKVISSLPMQGGAKAQTDTMINTIKQALEDHGPKSKDGKCTIEYQPLDDASAALGQWDPAVETANANKAVADSDVVAYLAPTTRALPSSRFRF